MGQRFDDLEELDHRARPAVADEQRQGRRPAALLMNEVDIDVLDRGGELREAV